jgi:hypothetical protein
MNRKISARIASIIMIFHGIIEVSGLMGLIAPTKAFAQTMVSFGGMGKEQIASNMISISLLGLIWGITRFIAAVGIWSQRKWAIVLGCAVSIASLIAAISIIPAGVMDTFLGAPVLILLLYTWLGNDKLQI